MPDRREYMKAWRAKNRPRLLEYHRKYNAEHKEERQALDRKRRGQTSLPTRSKPKKCECCENKPARCEDYDHFTGLFRGWLCDNCNLGLGLVGDTLEDIEKCKHYLTLTS